MNAVAGKQRDSFGFSLVEVTVAIGIFAFVIVGILGLIPTALKLRAESSQETRAVMIAQEIFSSLSASGGPSAGVLRDGPGLTGNHNVDPPVDLRSQTIMLGYPPQTTVPFFLWHSSRGMDPESTWQSGQLRQDAIENDIQTLAIVSGETVEGSPYLFRVTVQVRSPATVPLQFTTPISFTTLVYSPQ